MSVTVILPWAGHCPHRSRALRFLLARYAQRHPWRLVIADGGDPWNKSEAVMPAVGATHDEIVVMVDADVWCEEIAGAVEAVEQGAAWAIPHKAVYRLTEESTERWLAGEHHENLPLTQRAYRGIEGGGCVVTRRETLLSIPLDPRFVGWGQEDQSHGIALRTLLGAPHRIFAPLVHLWHPPQERLTRKIGSVESRALFKRYVKAAGDPLAMRQLLSEAACPSPPSSTETAPSFVAGTPARRMTTATSSLPRL